MKFAVMKFAEKKFAEGEDALYFIFIIGTVKQNIIS